MTSLSFCLSLCLILLNRGKIIGYGYWAIENWPRKRRLCDPFRLFPHESQVPRSWGFNIWTQISLKSEPEFVNVQGAQESIPGCPARQIGLSYRPVRLKRLGPSIRWNRFLGSLNVYKFGWVVEWGGGHHPPTLLFLHLAHIQISNDDISKWFSSSSLTFTLSY